MVEFSLYRAPQFVAGLAMLALGLWMFTLRSRHRVHFAFAAFLVTRATIYLVLPFSQHYLDFLGRLLPYLFITVALLGLYVALVFIVDSGPWPTAATRPVERAITVALVGLGVVSVGAYAWDHTLFETTILGLFMEATWLGYVAIAFAAAYIYISRPLELRNRAFVPLWIGFSLEAFYFPFWSSVTWIYSLQRDAAPPIEGLALAAWSMRLAAPLLLTGLAAYLLLRARRDPEERLKADATVYAVLLATVALTALAAFTMSVVRDQSSMWIFGFDALWHIMLVAFVGYAIVRYELMGIELRIKWTINYGSVAAGLAVLFFAASELLEMMWDANESWIALGSAGLISLAIRPLHARTKALSDRLMPHVEDTPEYWLRRRSEIYRAAVMTARRDGITTPEEKRALRHLAADLGLADQERRIIEAA